MAHRSAMQRTRCLLAVLLLLARWPSPPVSATVRGLKPRWPPAAHRGRRPAAPTLSLRGGDQSDEHMVPERSAPNRELLRLHSENKGGRAAGMQRAEGSSTGAQTEMAEDYLRQLPAGLNDWRFGLAAGSEKHKFVVRSAFRQKHSFAERAEMAAPLLQAPRPLNGDCTSSARHGVWLRRLAASTWQARWWMAPHRCHRSTPVLRCDLAPVSGRTVGACCCRGRVAGKQGPHTPVFG